MGENSNKLGGVTIESTTTVGLEVGFQPRTRSIWFKHLPFLSLVSRNFVAIANLAIFLLEVVNFNTSMLCTSRVPSIGHSLAYFVPYEFRVVHGV